MGIRQHQLLDAAEGSMNEEGFVANFVMSRREFRLPLD
jgi:hypothetical protein